jgi:hypothetical protein
MFFVLIVYKIDVGHIHIEGGVSTHIFSFYIYYVFRSSPSQESALFSNEMMELYKK